ncbi:flagella basal body P-ring formation protein FlgA [Betaproteobacteria bacterium GR16-43]|nr:flagella basal body P-ring formation protein FlgA [Betaproteobacteria bacterium GR16-43]
MKRRSILLYAVLAALPAGVSAASPAAQAAEAAQAFLDREIANLPGRVDITVGEVDPRLTLAPCDRIEPFLPTGARLWGKGFLGLKCATGAAWRVTIPVDVRVYASVPVANRALRAGEPVGLQDVETKEIEVSAHAPGLLADIRAAEGRVLARPVAAGAPIRADQFKNPVAIAAGDPVRVVLTGRGFDISLDGKALSAGAVGDNLRVQLGTGRTVGGILRTGRVVEVPL